MSAFLDYFKPLILILISLRKTSAVVEHESHKRRKALFASLILIFLISACNFESFILTNKNELIVLLANQTLNPNQP